MLNNNYQNILIKFGLWLGTGFLIAIVGISNVFAYTYEDIGYFNSNSQVQVEVSYNDSPLTLNINNEYYLQDVYSLDIHVSNINLSQDYVYWFEIYLPQTSSINANASDVTWYGDNNTTGTCTILTTYFSNNYPHVTFKCNGSTNIKELYIRYYNSSNDFIISSSGNYFKWNYTYMRRRTPDSNDNTGNITDSIQQNTQDIINNQNQNTQDMIDSQKVCKNYDKSSLTLGYIITNGSLYNIGGTAWGVTDYINITNSDIEILTAYSASTTQSQFCFYDANKTRLSCITLSNLPVGILSIPTNAVYIRSTIHTSSNTPYFKVCQSGNQALNDSINGLNSSLTDSSPVDMGSLGNTAGWLPPGPIDSIINLPLNLFNNLLTALNGTCQPINIPLPYVNKILPIPCISTIFNQITGLPTFWNWVGAITSVVILYRYLLALYKYYDDLTTLKANFISDFGGEP